MRNSYFKPGLVYLNVLIFSLLVSWADVAIANHSELAIQCLEKGNYECMKTEFEKSIEEEENLGNALFLGDMYLRGHGVVQNNDMAIEYYTLALCSGKLPKFLRMDAAFGMAMAHNNKVLDLNWTEGPSFGESVINAYVWLRIAQAYGKVSWKSERGEIIQITEVLNFYSRKLAENGINLVEVSEKAQKVKELIDKEAEVVDSIMDKVN